MVQVAQLQHYRAPNAAAQLQQMQTLAAQRRAAGAESAINAARFNLEERQFQHQQTLDMIKTDIERFDFALNVLSGVNSEEDLEIARGMLNSRYPDQRAKTDDMLSFWEPNKIEMFRNTLRTETQRLKQAELRVVEQQKEDELNLERDKFNLQTRKQEFEERRARGYSPGTLIKTPGEADQIVPTEPDQEDFELFQDSQGNQAYLQEGATVPKGWKKVGSDKKDKKSYDLFTDEDGNLQYLVKGSEIPEGWTKTKSGGGVTINLPKAAPASERESLNRLFEFDSQLDRIEGLFKPEYVGRIQGPIGAGKELTGLGVKPGEVEFRQIVNDISDTLLRLRSGAQINEQEYKRLRRLVPTMNLPDDVFLDKLKSLKIAIGNSIRIRKSSMGESGFVVPTGGQEGETPAGADAPTVLQFDERGNLIQ